MAKKNVDGIKVAENLVKDSNVSHVKVFQSRWATGYPPCITEQIHSASLSEIIRAGTGTALEPEQDKEMYDFPDGKDDGSKPVGVFDLSEPADVFEQEQSFKSDLQKSLSQQIMARKRAETEKASKNITDPEKSSQNQSSSVSEDLKGSGVTTAV